MSEIERYYNERYDEWARLDRHRLEFDVTRWYLDQHLPKAGYDILDIGGGPGRYAIDLAKKGHRVTLADLSARHLEVAREKAAEAGVTLEGYLHANVLDMRPERTYDCVLLMGPLYHLLAEADRRRAVENALTFLRPGGLLVTAFISHYAPLVDTLANHLPIDDPAPLLAYLRDGQNNEDLTGFTVAYFSSPEEAQALMASFPLETLAFAGVENILAPQEDYVLSLDEEAYQRWLSVAIALSRDPHLWGCSHHYLHIARKR